MPASSVYRFAYGDVYGNVYSPAAAVSVDAIAAQSDATGRTLDPSVGIVLSVIQASADATGRTLNPVTSAATQRIGNRSAFDFARAFDLGA